MFKNITVYRTAAEWAPTVDEMAAALEKMKFVPCGATQQQAVGWVDPRGTGCDALIESIAGARIMRLRIEAKGVPGVAVRKKAQEAADHIEQTTARKPGKKEMKSLKEDALLALLPQAFPRQTDVWVWHNPASGMLIVDASSQGAIDDVITSLVRTFDNLSLCLLQTNVSPQTAMTEWLNAEPEDVPGDFEVGRACELKSGDEDKAVIKFSRHNLATDEIRKHITEGKLPTQLAISYSNRVAFLMTAGMQLRKVTFLDGVFDGRKDEAESGFDADVALTTGELDLMIPALVEAMGGELVLQAQEAAPGTPTIYTDGEPDPLLDQARALVIADDRPSVSYIQRNLQIGYNRAARLLEDLENMGVVSPMDNYGARTVIVNGGS